MSYTFIISGHPTELEFLPSTPAQNAIIVALHATRHDIPQPSEWELRDEAGYLFDPMKPLADRASEGDKLYLNPRAGVGG